MTVSDSRNCGRKEEAPRRRGRKRLWDCLPSECEWRWKRGRAPAAPKEQGTHPQAHPVITYSLIGGIDFDTAVVVAPLSHWPLAIGMSINSFASHAPK